MRFFNKAILIFLALLLSHEVYSQERDIFGVNRSYPMKFKKKKDGSETFINYGNDSIISLQFFHNRLFAYTCTTSAGSKVFVGNFRTSLDTLILYRDSTQDYSIFLDSILRAKPLLLAILPPRISYVKYLFDTKHLELRQPLSKYDIAEIYFSSSKVSDGGYIIDSLKSLRFNAIANKLIAKTVTQKLKFSLDSIWGYRIFSPSGKSGYLHRVRGVGGQGLPIIQNDKIIVYRIGTGRQYFFYLSKTLDSEIFDFNKETIKQNFRDNPRFLQLIDENKDWGKAKHVNGRLQWTIVDLYKQSLTK
jgi:hypothetical protein